MLPVKLVICDMAGTTVKDIREVEGVFFDAIRQTGLQAEPAEVNAMMGWSKIKVFQTLWEKQIGKEHPEFDQQVNHSYQTFTNLLEQHYTSQPVTPTDGALELFRFCRENEIKIALTTGFYRKVTDIILSRLGWMEGLDSNYIRDNRDGVIDCSVSSSDVAEGRPAPDMIRLAMTKLAIEDPQEVINIGDTPSDLLSGTKAGVRMCLGVSNGTHTLAELSPFPNHGILPSVRDLIKVIQAL